MVKPIICISIVLGIFNLKKDTYNKNKNCNQQKITCPTKKKPFKKCLKRSSKPITYVSKGAFTFSVKTFNGRSPNT